MPRSSTLSPIRPRHRRDCGTQSGSAGKLPALKSIAPRYPNDFSSPAFASRLDGMIEVDEVLANDFPAEERAARNEPLRGLEEAYVSIVTFDKRRPEGRPFAAVGVTLGLELCGISSPSERHGSRPCVTSNLRRRPPGHSRPAVPRATAPASVRSCRSNPGRIQLIRSSFWSTDPPRRAHSSAVQIARLEREMIFPNRWFGSAKRRKTPG